MTISNRVDDIGLKQEPESGSEQTVLSVVIVNYNGWDDVRRLVSSLCLSDRVGSGAAEVLVVDNASPESMPADFNPLPVGCRLLCRADNGGFAVGVNAGWREAKGRWLLVLNPDVVAEADLIGRILDRIKTYEGRPGRAPGLVGYALKNQDGSPQPSVGAFPSLWLTLREQLIPRSRRKYQPDWRVRAGSVPWVTGACVLMDSEMLSDVGGMDEDFFLYYEEVALCKSATDLGWTVEFDPAVGVIHLRPLQNRAISPKMRLVTRHSKLLYFRKHLSQRDFRWLARVILVEARIRGWLAGWSRQVLETRAWRAIWLLARLMSQGSLIKGSVVRDASQRLSGSEPVTVEWFLTGRESGSDSD